MWVHRMIYLIGKYDTYMLQLRHPTQIYTIERQRKCYACSHLDRLVDVKHWLQFHEQLPFLSGYIVSVELLQRVNRLSRDERVQCVLLFDLSAVKWLVRTLDLDGDRGLTLLANRNCFVFSFDRCSVAC